MKTLVELANRARELSGVRIYKRNVEAVLSAVQKSGDFWEIIDMSDLPVPAASGIVKVLIEEGILFIDDEENLRLTQKGFDLVRELGIEPFTDYTCKACEGRGIPFYADIELYREFIQLTKDRPKAIRDYDQGSVTPETTIARVLFIDSRGDLRNKDIIVLGAEDDLTGLAIALTRKARSVLVIDIDKRLIDFDNRIFKELGIDNAEARVWDLRNPFPQEMLGKFDVFVSDPPETLPAFRAFIGRGIATLREEGGVGYFGLTLRDSSVFRWRDFQIALTSEFGVAITDIVQDFNHYITWDYHKETKAAELAPVKKDPKTIWYKSAWYRVEVLPGFKRWNEVISDNVFYLDEEGSTT
ncbi:bis-aminopropyl spermidine synthase family protein [Thermocrinis jamiesonii]|jgi:Predicted methyltransferases|uniref:bis-aminopropyl spermidine synthase family protein n=1 Tax=Thermocrinis jamiesonii TaxID=1302351 RepID=UPI000496837C|nr:bis-aminopropyl spermidine synthase family protein [Thermocrinis jamiesonii]